jgi:hypothetical protein
VRSRRIAELSLQGKIYFVSSFANDLSSLSSSVLSSVLSSVSFLGNDISCYGVQRYKWSCSGPEIGQLGSKETRWPGNDMLTN